MATRPTSPLTPPPALLQAMQTMRAGNMRSALDIVEAALPGAEDRVPYLALGGHAALHLGQTDRAIALLEELLALRPGDRATRANLANAWLRTGRKDRAMTLVEGADDPSLARIEAFIHQEEGRLDSAAAIYRRVTDANADDLSSWNNLGNVLAATGDIEGAIKAFERAITLAPAEVPIYLNLAELLRQADRHGARLKTLLDAEKVAPDDPQLLTELGLAHATRDDLDAAVASFERAIALSPGFGAAHIELGMIYESLNRVDELAALIGRVDRDNAPPEFSFLLAWQARRDGRFEEAALLAAAIPETIHPLRRLHLIGGIADRSGDADAAFKAFEGMNSAALATAPPLKGPSFRGRVEADVAHWTDDWASGWPAIESDPQHRDPIFLVGFPRSGTTLLDTMLMGLPELSVIEERPMAARTLALVDADLLALTPERVTELRDAYFASAREWGWDETRWLVDKHPLNMTRLPFLHRLFPNARFIFAERHPYDAVLSCFMANFQMNFAMRSFASLDEAARTYHAAFTAWERAMQLFPADVHAVRYERLVADPRAELAPLVAWLGLQWDDALLDHQQIARSRGRVRTASYSQIGEQLYTRAADRWRRYAEHLAPVLPILRPWAERMGYEAD
ncbi:tetratricopeptide repeat-containing sulfotransferase family protein [Sphingopyxis sp. H115]|uniref:tetratricopeptide repeat-containing sulfotransferase family protein n=1 Tax=Sphingopyxis sp. H115 TaxID=1759073 RepID=UPI0009E94D0E|nr:tetratricopeptide repeat-containing sulfotransferase family protein [Sphingopyxis sp. H115]